MSLKRRVDEPVIEQQLKDCEVDRKRYRIQNEVNSFAQPESPESKKEPKASSLKAGPEHMHAERIETLTENASLQTLVTNWPSLHQRRNQLEFYNYFLKYFGHLMFRDQLVFNEAEAYQYKAENFERIETLGVGQSEVVKYFHKTSGREVAVKTLRYYRHRAFKSFKWDERSFAKIANEIAMLEKLGDLPGIVKYYGWASNIDYVNIFMEPAQMSLKTSNLAKYLADYFETSAMLNNVLYNILNALKFCKTRGVGHGDLKTSNILITHGWQIKLCDFGEAYSLNENDDPSTGSIAYWSPERFFNEADDVEKTRFGV